MSSIGPVLAPAPPLPDEPAPAAAQAPADAPLLGADGQFHLSDEAIDLQRYRLEDWLAVALFWVLGLVVFYQFFTRYALNDSASWTEEIARYLLIGVVFIGAAIPVRRNNHIQVDFCYRFMPRWLGRVMATLVDIVRVVFLLGACGLTVQLITRIGGSRMAVVDLPMGIVYAVVLAGFGLMAWRGVGVARRHWQQRNSLLEDPDMEVH
ncbi:TRAP transporter small permease [Ideonella sp. BN130291]|uniref:TRAP transporter small permease n=1 Tax=Ideonella sp. BN130291 TaxID=3112940 RepID=UPI002E276F30|nr:TRAP transporter small permease [Ideonella sp. BN130291]